MLGVKADVVTRTYSALQSTVPYCIAQAFLQYCHFFGAAILVAYQTARISAATLAGECK